MQQHYLFTSLNFELQRDEKSTELIVRKGSSATRAQSGLMSDSKRKPKKNAKTVKQMLGELFGDWQYLENILGDEG